MFPEAVVPLPLIYTLGVIAIISTYLRSETKGIAARIPNPNEKCLLLLIVLQGR